MAVARVGGSSGKMRGQVGDTIYQVKRNPDGTYTQYVYSKGGHTEETLTPKLQAQRMCVAMVQSIMRDLKPVGGISFEAGRNKTLSLNSFSSSNLRLVQRDCQDHWYSGNKFIFPARHRTDLQIKDLGGPFMLSSGSLMQNTFDLVEYDDRPVVNYQDISSWDYQLYGLRFSAFFGNETVDAFFRRHKMTRSDKVVFCGFRDWIDYTVHPDDPDERYQNDYAIASVNPRIPGETVLTPSVLPDLFPIASSIPFDFFIGRDNDLFCIGYLCDLQNADEQFFYTGGFSISYAKGKKQISTSFYENPGGGSEPWLLNAQPANVFGSWMGEPQVRPYPSPF